MCLDMSENVKCCLREPELSRTNSATMCAVKKDIQEIKCVSEGTTQASRCFYRNYLTERCVTAQVRPKSRSEVTQVTLRSSRANPANSEIPANTNASSLLFCTVRTFQKRPRRFSVEKKKKKKPVFVKGTASRKGNSSIKTCRCPFTLMHKMPQNTKCKCLHAKCLDQNFSPQNRKGKK